MWFRWSDSSDLLWCRCFRGLTNETVFLEGNQSNSKFKQFDRNEFPIGCFRPVDGSQRKNGTFFEARDQEPLMGISRVEDLVYDKDGSRREKSECSPQRGTGKSPETFMLGLASVQTTAERITYSTCSGAIIQELIRHSTAFWSRRCVLFCCCPRCFSRRGWWPWHYTVYEFPPFACFQILILEIIVSLQ